MASNKELIERARGLSGAVNDFAYELAMYETTRIAAGEIADLIAQLCTALERTEALSMERYQECEELHAALAGRAVHARRAVRGPASKGPTRMSGRDHSETDPDTDMMLGLVRCAEFKEQEDDGKILDDWCRRALERARSLGWGRHQTGEAPMRAVRKLHDDLAQLRADLARVTAERDRAIEETAATWKRLQAQDAQINALRALLPTEAEREALSKVMQSRIVKVISVGCSMCYDSTWDHECDDEEHEIPESKTALAYLDRLLGGGR